MSLSQCASDRFDEKYSLYSNMLYRLCMVYLKNHANAEDAMQEAFISLIYKAPKFKTQKDEQYWLVRVTINICKDHLKNSWNKKIVSFNTLENNESICMTQSTEDIFQLVQTLPEKYKTTIFLHYTEGFSVEEISQTLKIGVSAVKMRLKRGRDLLKIKLEV